MGKIINGGDILKADNIIMFVGALCLIVGSGGLIGVHIYEGISTVEEVLTNVFLFGITLFGANLAYTLDRRNKLECLK